MTRTRRRRLPRRMTLPSTREPTRSGVEASCTHSTGALAQNGTDSDLVRSSAGRLPRRLADYDAATGRGDVGRWLDPDNEVGVQRPGATAEQRQGRDRPPASKRATADWVMPAARKPARLTPTLPSRSSRTPAPSSNASRAASYASSAPGSAILVSRIASQDSAHPCLPPPHSTARPAASHPDRHRARRPCAPPQATGPEPAWPAPLHDLPHPRLREHRQQHDRPTRGNPVRHPHRRPLQVEPQLTQLPVQLPRVRLPQQRIDPRPGDHHHLRAGQQRRRTGHPGQQPPDQRAQLPHVAVVEGPQERPQRGRRADPPNTSGSAPCRRHVQVIDTVRTGYHPRHPACRPSHRGSPRPAPPGCHARRPAPPDPRSAPAAPPGPAPPATPDSDHRRPPMSSTPHATIASTRCALEPGRRKLRNSHRHSSGDTSAFRLALHNYRHGGSRLRLARTAGSREPGPSG